MNYIIASLLALLVLTPSIVMMAPSTASASLGMGNCQEDPKTKNALPQKERTGNDHSNDDERLPMTKMPTEDGPDEDTCQLLGQSYQSISQPRKTVTAVAI